MNVPVEIIRYDPQGYMFTERTRIEDITRMGCRFRLQTRCSEGISFWSGHGLEARHA